MAFASPTPVGVPPRRPPAVCAVRRRPRPAGLRPTATAARAPAPDPSPPGGRWASLWAWASRPKPPPPPSGVPAGPAGPHPAAADAPAAVSAALPPAAAAAAPPPPGPPPPSPPPPELELLHVHKAFDGKPVLNGISLSVHRGEAVGIIGPSGSGKSTLLRLLAGLDVPDAGAVRCRGWTRPAKVGSEPPEAGPNPLRLGMVFQNSALFDSLTVAENVGFQLLYGGDRSAPSVRLPADRVGVLVEEALRKVGLGGVGGKRPAELSGGMRRRVAFARAVICDPALEATRKDVVLMDEVTAGLDSMASTRVENLMVAMGDECPTRVVVTHQFSTIRRTVERVVFLHDGVLRWDGPVSELDTTDNPYVRQYFDASLAGPMRFADDEVLPSPDGNGVPADGNGVAP